jgi:FAD/FMN-containing dehydrogenase
MEELRKTFTGEILTDTATLEKYSRDASLFEVMPKAVVLPKNSADISALVRYVLEMRKTDSAISVTARAAGTDMTGGPLNESIIMDCTKHLDALISIDETSATVEPGMYYRTFEKETLKLNRIMPAYTASKEICAIGGMVANNSGGEKSIRYGKVENYVRSMKAVFADGNEYTVRPLTKEALDAKMAEDTYEGSVYRKLFTLLDTNYDAIKAAKPTVSKNSAGYYLWNVWDRETGIFDLTKLLVGSQGTLALTTEVTLGLVPVPKYSRMVVLYMPSIERLGDVVDTIMEYNPESFESYDDYSMKLAMHYVFDFFFSMGFFETIKMGLQFIPDMLTVLKGGVPKLILMAEVTGDDEQEVITRAKAIETAVEPFGYKTHVAKSQAEAQKYWKIRRESFNLLRKHVKGKRTAPFIDDIIVSPHQMPEFLPKLQEILGSYKLVYTIAGHAGNGNFHIIPLMDLDSPISGDIIVELSEKVYTLVAQYRGSITAEHNDGIIRTPFLSYMYSPQIIGYFKEVKDIFDPLNILNPGKKVGGSLQYVRDHLIRNHSTVHGS